MLLRPGLLVEIEGEWPIFVAEKVGRRRDAVVVGNWIYSDQGKALTPGAPDVIEAVDVNSQWKLHKKGAKSLKARYEAQQVTQLQAQARQRLLAGDEGWKHARPISAFPKEGFLKFTCRRCGRVRLDQIGRLCAEGRVGQRTVAELQPLEECLGCGGEVVIEME
jgi:hypothetical protein